MPVQKQKTSKKKEVERVLIVVPKPRNIVGDTETVVSVNGEMYQIMYDRAIEVHENVAEVIENSRRLQEEIAIITEQEILKAGKPSFADM